MARANKDSKVLVLKVGDAKHEVPTAFESEKALKKTYKHLDTAVVEAWANELKGEYKPCPDSEPIHRMRVCMAVLHHYYPKQTKAKTVSKYAQYSTEDLVQMAVENEILFETSDDMRIVRMRAIMALRVAGLVE